MADTKRTTQLVQGDNVKQEETPSTDPTQHERDSAFTRELEAVINKHCRENGSDTPDFILAAYMDDCLTAFNRATNWRTKWYSPEGVPANERKNGPPPRSSHPAKP